MIEFNEQQDDTKAPLIPEDDCLLVCNEAPSRFWAHSLYNEEAVHKLCAEITNEWMFAAVTLHGGGKFSFSVSQKTWDRHEGHYPAVMQLFNIVAKDPRLAHLQGSFVVWLEDGMWDWCRSYSRRAPILSFGRSISDSTTFLIPDPAFAGGLGYALERKQSEHLNSRIPWQQRRSTIFWRGAATGIGIEGPDWLHTARAKLVLAAKEIGDPHLVDAKLTRIQHLPPHQILNLARERLVHDEVPFEDFFKYKYMVDADGYHCAWKSLFLKLMMGSVVLKIDSPFEQWYHRTLKPWRHFIPVSRDVKELREIHQWLVAHDLEARAIAQEGGDFISRISLESALDGVVMVVENILAARTAQ
jgi:hypothetical protein